MAKGSSEDRCTQRARQERHRENRQEGLAVQENSLKEFPENIEIFSLAELVHVSHMVW